MLKRYMLFFDYFTHICVKLKLVQRIIRFFLIKSLNCMIYTCEKYKIVRTKWFFFNCTVILLLINYLMTDQQYLHMYAFYQLCVLTCVKDILPPSLKVRK